MVHFIHLGTQLWQKDWLIYEKPGIRLDVWGEIHVSVLSLYYQRVSIMPARKFRSLYNTKEVGNICTHRHGRERRRVSAALLRSYVRANFLPRWVKKRIE